MSDVKQDKPTNNVVELITSFSKFELATGFIVLTLLIVVFELIDGYFSLVPICFGGVGYLLLVLYNIRSLLCLFDKKKKRIIERKVQLLEIREREWGKMEYGAGLITMDCEIFSYVMYCRGVSGYYFLMTEEKYEKLLSLIQYASQEMGGCQLQFTYYKFSKVVLDIDLSEDVEYSEEFRKRWNEIAQMF